MGRKENKCSGKNYGSFFPKQLSNLGPERNNTWAGHSAAILPEKPACLEAAIPDLDDSNNLLDRRPGVFFFFNDRVVWLSTKYIKFYSMYCHLLLNLL